MVEQNKDLTRESEKFEELALEDVAYGTQHALNILLDLLIEKGIINEQEFKDKLDELIDASEDIENVDLADQIGVELPDKDIE